MTAITQLRGTQIIDGTITPAKVTSGVIIASGANAFTGIQDHGGFKITGVGTCVSGTDAANKTYVDTNAFAVAKFIVRELPTGLVNSSNTSYALANSPVTGSESIFLNGILLESGGNDYSISTLTITMVSAPITNDRLRCSYIST